LLQSTKQRKAVQTIIHCTFQPTGYVVQAGRIMMSCTGIYTRKQMWLILGQCLCIYLNRLRKSWQPWFL